MSRTDQVAIGLLLWLTLAAVAWIYWPGLQSPAMLDDGMNLTHLDSIEESAEYIEDVVFGNRSGPLGRPVTMLTFGIERLAYGPSLSSTKYNNVLLHLMCGALLFWVLFRLGRMSGLRDASFVAWAGTALWLVSPLWVSTVLYAVQRMALLAALFSLLSMLMYIVGRQRMERSAGIGALLVLFAGIAGGLSTLAKENGAITFLYIVLLELWVFRFKGVSESMRRLMVLAAALTLIVFAGAGALATYSAINGDFAQTYSSRPFSLTERLLTQSRVVMQYIWGMGFAPLDELGLYQDKYPISRGLVEPVTTLLALTGILLMLAFIVFSCKRRHLSWFGFGLLFWLSGHLIESTVVPLELYFEHRAYLPATGLLVGLVLGLGILGRDRPALYYSWIVGLCLLLILLAAKTSVRVNIWSNEIVHSMHEYESRPESTRAALAMAKTYAIIGDAKSALRYSDQVPTNPQHVATPILRDALYECVADKDSPANRLWDVMPDRLEAVDRHFNDVLYSLIKLYIDGHCQRLEADALSEWLSDSGTKYRRKISSPRLFKSTAVFENHREDYDRAFAASSAALEIHEYDPQSLLMHLYFARKLGMEAEVKRASRALRKLSEQGKLNAEQVDDVQALFPITRGLMPSGSFSKGE